MQDALLESFIERYGLSQDAEAELRKLQLLPDVALTTEPVQLSDATWTSAPEGRSIRRVGRYEDMGTLGVGGMAEVRRVRDPVLNRVMAAKMMHPDNADAHQVTRFIEEAQVTAQLRHPSIVAVHELGRHEDGRVYFTMEEVRGQTLVDVIDELHSASGHGRWGKSANDWSLERVVESFRRACEAVAYAHSRGVVHRDLKPANVMLGRFGEVVLLDWGLAKVFNQGHSDDLPAVVTKRSSEDSTLTQVGRVLGTPAYMPPEQARGELERVGTASDVYALGAILYTILCGRAPYSGKSSERIIRAVLAGPPRSLEEWEGIPQVPEHLRVICAKAMAREPTARHYDAMELAQDVSSWLDGSQRKTKARELVSRARATLPAAAALAEEADRLRLESRERLEPIAAHEPVDRKRPAWMLEQLADQLQDKAAMRVLEAIRTLQAALNLAPELEDAHEALAEVYRDQHEQAEARDDIAEAARLEVLLRDHARGPELRRYLEGDGSLTLLTDPPGATAKLYRYVERDRRLVAEYLRDLGQTPLRGVSLPMGSYLIELEIPGRPKARYPVRINRLQHWDGVPPHRAGPAAHPHSRDAGRGRGLHSRGVDAVRRRPGLLRQLAPSSTAVGGRRHHQAHSGDQPPVPGVRQRPGVQGQDQGGPEGPPPLRDAHALPAGPGQGLGPTHRHVHVQRAARRPRRDGGLALRRRLRRLAGSEDRTALASARRAHLGEGGARGGRTHLPLGKPPGPHLVQHAREPGGSPSYGACRQL